MPSSFSDPLGQAQAEQLFSLKEWMVAISGKLDRLETKLDGKADIGVVHDLVIRTSEIEKRLIAAASEREYLVPQHVRMLEDVGVLKQKAAAIQSVESYRRWVWGTAFTSLVSLVLTVITMTAKG